MNNFSDESRWHKVMRNSCFRLRISLFRAETQQRTDEYGEFRMKNLEKYNHIFMDVLGVSEDALGETFTFKDVIQWDSVAHLSLISELEDAFDVMFEPDDILHYGSYGNGKKILKKYGIDMGE